jgi:hypothetical protein
MCEGVSKISGPIPTDPIFLNKFNSISISSARSNSVCEGPSKISGPIASNFGFESEEEKARKRYEYFFIIILKYTSIGISYKKSGTRSLYQILDQCDSDFSDFIDGFELIDLKNSFT